MNLYLFIPLLFGLQVFYWLIARRSTKDLNTTEDYFLAGKNIRFFPLMMTFLATQVGGGLVIGASNEAYEFGWYVLFYPLGAALGLILLGLGLGRKLSEFKVTTVAQILETVYRSPLLKKIASILSIISLFMVLIGMILASSQFLGSLGLSSVPLFILFWAVVIIYTVQGGLKAVISTDIVQAVVFSAIFFLAFGFVLFSAPVSMPQIVPFELVSSKIYGWLLMPLLFMVIEQDMAQRCFAGKSGRVVSLAAFCSGIFTFIICFIPVFFGVYAKSIGLTVPANTSVLMTVIAKMTNPLIAALTGCAIIAAIISTATSLINAISSNITSDFLPKKNTLRVAKWITALICLSAILFSFYSKHVVDVLIVSYELSVSCLVVPIVIALFKKQGNFLSALLAILMGAIGFCLFRLYPIALPREVASVLLSLFGFVVGEWVARYRIRAIAEV